MKAANQLIITTFFLLFRKIEKQDERAYNELSENATKSLTAGEGSADVKELNFKNWTKVFPIIEYQSVNKKLGGLLASQAKKSSSSTAKTDFSPKASGATFSFIRPIGQSSLRLRNTITAAEIANTEIMR